MLSDLDTGVTYYKFIANNTQDGYIFPYTISSGISDQSISIQLLKEKGYNDHILKSALTYINKKTESSHN
jgi:DNA mismatch repair ATPase MutS